MTEIVQALRRLQDAVALASESDSAWRWTTRQELSRVRDLLGDTHLAAGINLAARARAAGAERRVLLSRIAAVGPEIISSPDVETVRADVRRLVTDVLHHVQRVNDLAWDAVELELGGSE